MTAWIIGVDEVVAIIIRAVGTLRIVVRATGRRVRRRRSTDRRAGCPVGFCVVVWKIRSCVTGIAIEMTAWILRVDEVVAIVIRAVGTLRVVVDRRGSTGC